MKNIIFIGRRVSHIRFNIYYEIEWTADEDFDELIKFGQIPIYYTTAEKIESLEGLSLRSKILLSAMAGAAIQYLLDNNIPFEEDWEIKAYKKED